MTTSLDTPITLTLASPPHGLHVGQQIAPRWKATGMSIAPDPRARRDLEHVRELVAAAASATPSHAGSTDLPRWPSHGIRLSVVHDAWENTVAIQINPVVKRRAGCQRRWQSLSELADTILEALVGPVITHASQVDVLDLQRIRTV